MINNRDKEYLKAFGKNLRKLREAKGLSQHDLALKAEINKNQIGNIERGEVNTTISTVNVISEVLGVEPKELFDFNQ